VRHASAQCHAGPGQHAIPQLAICRPVTCLHPLLRWMLQRSPHTPAEIAPQRTHTDLSTLPNLPTTPKFSVVDGSLLHSVLEGLQRQRTTQVLQAMQATACSLPLGARTSLAQPAHSTSNAAGATRGDWGHETSRGERPHPCTTLADAHIHVEVPSATQEPAQILRALPPAGPITSSNTRRAIPCTLLLTPHTATQTSPPAGIIQTFPKSHDDAGQLPSQHLIATMLE
jgi:hypothetical protein